MQVDTAVVLAAGRGIRLGPLGRSIPKGFVRPERRTLIEESIGKLRSCGISQIVIVTGHLRRFYEALRVDDEILTTVHTPHFAESDSMNSLARARDVVRGDFLLLESDIVYETRAVDAAIKSPHQGALVLSGPTNSGDEVYVEVEDGTVVALSKNRAALRKAPASSSGFRKFRELFQHMLREVQGKPSAAYDTDTLSSLARDYPIPYILIHDLVWAEIDTREHLVRVRQRVYPLLCNLDPLSGPDQVIA